MEKTLSALPSIFIQNMSGGRHVNIDIDVVDKILSIDGVSDAIPRVWGYYYFENAGVSFSIVGIDKFASQYKQTLANIADTFELENRENDAFMVVGEGVKKKLLQNYYKEYFNFIKSN